MEETQKTELYQQLHTLDTSLAFLVLSLLSLCLSLKATDIQRGGLCDVLLGKSEDVPDVFPIRIVASTIVISALTIAFGLALNIWEKSRQKDQTARCSADRNVWAALFALAAALIRLYDLNYVRSHQPDLEEEILPD